MTPLAAVRRLPPAPGGLIAKERRVEKNTGQYSRAIRAAVRGLWSGALSYEQFYDAMYTAIQYHVPLAWYAGAKACGILPNELTQAERVEMARSINYELQWIEGFAVAIQENSKADGGALQPLFTRSKIWIGRWEGIKSQAMAMACADKKLKWVQGPSEQGCKSCTKLNGKIKRASVWNEQGILPRVHGSEKLACRGFRCLCTLVPTDEPASKGPLPNLP